MIYRAIASLFVLVVSASLLASPVGAADANVIAYQSHLEHQDGRYAAVGSVFALEEVGEGDVRITIIGPGAGTLSAVAEDAPYDSLRATLLGAPVLLDGATVDGQKILTRVQLID